jgi:hypothetical protein
MIKAHEPHFFADFKEVDMTDYGFAKYCRDNGWEGEVNKLTNWTQFILPNGTVIAIVKYKNHEPINRWIYLPKENNHEKN